MRFPSPRPALIVVALLLALSALGAFGRAPALAAGVLDANYESGGGASTVALSGVDHPWGETFVAGRSGRVDRAGLRFQRQSSDVTVQFELWPTSGGLPTGAPLATQQTVVTGNPLFPIDWIEVNFATPATVVAGQTYALMASWVSGPFINLIAKLPGEYAGGVAVGLTPTPTVIVAMDINFRIYIDSVRLNLTAAAAPNPVGLGQPLTFTFTVTNTGTSAAANTVLTVDLPSVVQVQAGGITVDPVLVDDGAAACRVITLSRLACTLGSVAAGQGAVVAIPVRIISTTLGAQLCARGIVTGGPAGMTSTAIAQACARTATPGDLVVSLACPAEAVSGVNLITSCTATVRNAGGAALTVIANQVLLRIDYTGVRPADAAPTLDVTAPSPSGYTKDYTHFNYPDFQGFIAYRATANDTIPAGGTRTFAASIISSLTGPGTYIPTATVDPNGVIAEGNEANNSAGPVATTVLTPVCGCAPLELELQAALADGAV